MHKYYLIPLLLFLNACDDRVVQADTVSMEKSRWSVNQPASFSFIAPDTTDTYNLFFHVRNNQEYNFKNIYLISSMQFPMGKIITDTLQYEMAESNGEYMGSGSGGVYESKLWYKDAIRFRESGEYQLKIWQAMRKNDEVNPIQNLQGILNVGYSIEKTIPNGDN